MCSHNTLIIDINKQIVFLKKIQGNGEMATSKLDQKARYRVIIEVGYIYFDEEKGKRDLERKSGWHSQIFESNEGE